MCWNYRRIALLDNIEDIHIDNTKKTKRVYKNPIGTYQYAIKTENEYDIDL